MKQDKINQLVHMPEGRCEVEYCKDLMYRWEARKPQIREALEEL